VFLKLHHAGEPAAMGLRGLSQKIENQEEPDFECIQSTQMRTARATGAEKGGCTGRERKEGLTLSENHLFSFLSFFKQNNFQYIQALPRSSDCCLMAITGSLQSLTSVTHFGSHFTFNFFFKEKLLLQ